MIKFVQSESDQPSDENDVDTIRSLYPKKFVIPFNSKNKYQVHVHEHSKTGNHTVLMKGAPERILDRCTHAIVDGKVVELTEEERRNIVYQQESLSANGLRCLYVIFSFSDVLINYFICIKISDTSDGYLFTFSVALLSLSLIPKCTVKTLNMLPVTTIVSAPISLLVTSRMNQQIKMAVYKTRCRAKALFSLASWRSSILHALLSRMQWKSAKLLALRSVTYTIEFKSHVIIFIWLMQ